MAVITELLCSPVRIWSSTDGVAGTPRTLVGTPAVGDLLVAITVATGATLANAPTDNNADGNGTSWVQICGVTRGGGVDSQRAWVRGALIGSATSTTFSHDPNTATTGAGFAIFKITGMTYSGLAAVMQYQTVSDHAASTPLGVALPAAPLTTNPMLGVVFNTNSAFTITPRAGWTEAYDVGFGVPQTGQEAMYISSGETNATITWGSASVLPWAGFVIEFNASSTPPFIAEPEETPPRARPQRDLQWLDTLRFLTVSPLPAINMLDDSRKPRPNREQGWVDDLRIIDITAPLPPNQIDDTRAPRPKRDLSWFSPLPPPSGIVPPAPIPPVSLAQDMARQLRRDTDLPQRNLSLLLPPTFTAPPLRADDWSVVRPPLNNRRSEYQENNIVFLLDLPPPVIPPPPIGGPPGGGHHRNTARRLLPMDRRRQDPFELSDEDLRLILAIIAAIEDIEG